MNYKIGEKIILNREDEHFALILMLFIRYHRAAMAVKISLDSKTVDFLYQCKNELFDTVGKIYPRLAYLNFGIIAVDAKIKDYDVVGCSRIEITIFVKRGK